MKLHVRPKFKPSTLLTGLFLFFLLGSILYLHFSQLLTIKKISCQVNNGSCPDYVQAELEKNLHHSLFFSRYDQIIATIIKRQPSLQNGQVSKNINGQVNFSFSQTIPIYALKTDSSPFFLVDQNGLIVAVSEESSLPKLFMSDDSMISLNQGVHLAPQLHQQLMTFFQVLQQSRVPYSTVKLLNTQEVLIQLPDNKQAVVLLEQAPGEIPKLQFLLDHQDQLQTKESFHLIDLRFKYPILKM